MPSLIHKSSSQAFACVQCVFEIQVALIPMFRVTPIRGKQYHHQVLFFGNHKKDPRVQKSAKSAILMSSMTVELLLVGQSLFKTYDL